jgi:subfamily B ATP-binding cassette protein MsbA
LRALLDMIPAARGKMPLLVILGVIASLAETAGISLIILFLYAALGQLDQPQAAVQTFGEVAAWVLHSLGGPTQLAAMIFALIVLRGIVGYVYNRISSALSARISETARNRIHHQYLHVAYEFIRRHEQAELMEILGTDSWGVAAANTALTRLIINLCAILVFAIVLFALSWKVTLAAALCAMLVSHFLGRLSRPVTDLGATVKAEHQSMGGLMLMTLQSMRAIRAYGQEAAQHRSFLISSAAARESLARLERLSAAIGPATEIGYLAILCLIVASASLLALDFHVTLTIVALLYRLQPHLREFEGNLLFLAQSAPQLQAVRHMIGPEGKSFPADGSQPLPASYDAIRFRNVSFAYDGHQALDNVTFEIPRGKVTALVGASGSGKTTIVNLLLRLYAPDGGHIFLDDAELGDIRRSEWLQELAVAGQDIDLFEGSVRDNVTMARAGADEAALAEAYALSGLTDLLASLEYGDASWVGQHGLNLSGGQRQRVGIARAILRDPGLLILDEATSALDTELEAGIRRALERRFEGRTILIITHRLETVRNVDHVIRLREGKVMAEGPPAILLDQRPAPSPTILPGSAVAAMPGDSCSNDRSNV